MYNPDFTDGNTVPCPSHVLPKASSRLTFKRACGDSGDMESRLTRRRRDGPCASLPTWFLVLRRCVRPGVQVGNFTAWQWAAGSWQSVGGGHLQGLPLHSILSREVIISYTPGQARALEDPSPALIGPRMRRHLGKHGHPWKR